MIDLQLLYIPFNMELYRLESRRTLTQTKGYVLKVIMIGDYGVGKTALAKRFYCSANEDKTFGNQKSFMSVYEGNVEINDDIVTIRILDTAGQERYRSMTGSYYRGMSCCLLVFDISNKTSFVNIESWYDELCHSTSDIERVTTILVGINRKSRKRDVTSEQCEKLSEHLDLPYVETDIEDESQVLDLFKVMASSAISQFKCRASLSMSGSSNTSSMSSNSEIKLTRLIEKAKRKCKMCSC